MMFKKVLVANRGEIAVRVIRACRELGIDTVAVYSEADQESLHVTLADEAYCIGPAVSKDSYLNMTNLMSVATLVEADAVHPGYGFLAENADFAELCAACNITFIGPDPQAIVKMGDKTTARETMKAAGVPVVPGTEGVIEYLDFAVETARDIGYPVIVKATAGGGGKGMRVVHTEEELKRAIQMAQQEAEANFGNPGVYLVEIPGGASSHRNPSAGRLPWKHHPLGRAGLLDTTPVSETGGRGSLPGIGFGIAGEDGTGGCGGCKSCQLFRSGNGGVSP